MSTSLHARAKDLFLDLLEASPEERAKRLAELSPEDEALRREVESLLAHHEADVASASSGPPAPPIIEGYRLLKPLGAGGMGVVYEAEQLVPVQRRVAVKVIRLGMSTEEVIARFESERQALALMDHPNVASVLDAGATADGRPFFAMELVAGAPLTEAADALRLTVEERLRLFLQVCRGVSHAHQKGVIHRDLKPSNVLVRQQDGEPTVKIIDFGIAKATVLRLTERTLLTEQGQWMGTPEYMSPEQAEMSALDVDTRTDVYSLGVLLYELLVGAHPLDPGDLRRQGLDEIRRRIREEEPPRPSARATQLRETGTTTAAHRRTDPAGLTKRLQGDLDWIVMKALEKDRARRYASVQELADDLSRHLAWEPVSAGPPSTLYRLSRFVRRHRLGVSAAAAVAAAVIVGLVLAVTGLVRASQAERQAREEAAAARQVSEYLIGVFEVLDPGTALPSTSPRQILDAGSRRIEEELAGQPQVQARLRATLGRVYRNLGHLEQARPLLEQALATRRNLLGEEHPAVAESLRDLGWLAYEEAEYSQATELLQEAAALQEKLGVEPLDFAATLNLLGFVNWRTGAYEEAESLYRRALELRTEGLGPEDPAVAATLYSLGILFLETGETEAAEEVLLQALDIRQATLGPRHTAVAWALHEVGRVRLVQERHEEARELFQQSAEIQTEALGPRHPFVAFPLTKLAYLETLQGNLETAEATFQEALQIRERALGENHPDVAWTLRPYAGLKWRQGRPDEERALLERALEIEEEAYGSHHVEVARTLQRLAFFEYRQEDYPEALDLQRRSVEAREAAMGKEHPNLAIPVFNLGALAVLNGQKEEGIELLGRSLDLGYSGEGILTDRDLDGVRGLPAFRQLEARAQEGQR